LNDIYKTGQNADFIIDLDYFSGPLNILLDLISKKREFIYEIKIIEIIRDFLKFINTDGKKTLDELSGFVYIISIMLDIKSKSLIPSRNDNNVQEDSDDSLKILKLRDEEYRTFRKISMYFSELIENEEVYFIREAAVEEQFLDFFNEVFKKIKAEDLQNIASRLLSVKQEKFNIAEFYNKKITRNIFQEINRIKTVLKSKDNISFKELTSDYKDLIDIVISFLSILELYKNEDIDIEQFEIFGEIIIKKIAV